MSRNQQPSRKPIILFTFICLLLLAGLGRGLRVASAIDEQQSAEASCLAPPSGLVAWYPGDGNSNDISGKSNNGTLQGGATFAAGKVGQAFSFDGSSGSLVIPDSDSLDLTTQFTLDAWINPASQQNDTPFPGRGAIISKVGGPNGNNGYQFGITGNNTQVLCQFNAQGEPWPANQLIVTLPNAIPINTWTHLACTYDNANLNIYVNGASVGTKFVGAKSVVNSASNLRISGDDNNNVFFHGLIDEPEIFNRALTQTEIQSVFNADSAGKCKTASCVAPPAGMAAWYRFDGSGIDYSGNNNHGALSDSYSFGTGKVSQGLQVTDGGARVSNAASLRPANAITVEGWVKANSSPGTFRYILAKIYDNCSSSYGLYTGGSGGLSFYVRTGTDCFAFTRSPDAGTKIWDGQFHHVAGSYDGSTVRLFVDGVEQDGGTPTSGPILYQSTVAGGDLFIGRPNFAAQNFNGTIDELTIYNRALSQAEIQGIINAGGAGKCATGPAPTPTPTPVPTPTPSPTPSPTPTPSTSLTISGRVTKSDGSGVVNVRVSLEDVTLGRFNAERLTDANGFYQFTVLFQSGTYNVTPSASGFTFQPGKLTFNNLSSSQTNVNFTAVQTQAPTFTIGGRLALSPVGIGLSGFTITLNSGSALTLTTTTDSSGHYAFTNLPSTPPDPRLGYRVSAGFPTGFITSPTSAEIPTLTRNVVVDFAASSAQPSTDFGVGRIAYIDYFYGGGLHVMDGDGSGDTVILRSGNNAQFGGSFPAWSPDGSQIAFNYVDGIYIVNFDGSGLKKVPISVQAPRAPTWSPDGSQLAFYGYCGSGGNDCIYAVNLDGSNLKKLTLNGGFNLFSDSYPDWGKNHLIAFQRETPCNTCPGNQIYAMKEDGTDIRQYVTGPGAGSDDQKPAWDPAHINPGTLAFLRGFRGNSYLIGGSGKSLVAAFSKPAWNPAGDKIAYEAPSQISGHPENTIWIISSAGGRPTRLRDTGHQPTWAKKFDIPTPTGGGNSIPASPTGGTGLNLESINGVSAEGIIVGSGNVSVNFSSVQTAGQTIIDPITPTALPLPEGYAVTNSAGVAYNINTTASVTAPITTCIKVPTINDEAVFNSLRILHSENGTLVDRTILGPSSYTPNYSTRTICAGTNTLDSFVVVQKIETSLPIIDGLIVDSNGNPVSDVTVNLRGDLTLSTQTDINGRFKFVNLARGGNYQVTPAGGTFTFGAQSQSFTNLQADQAPVFTATACGLGLSAPSAYFTQTGGTSTFNINAASSGCGWSMFTDSSWVTITSPTSGGGAGTVQFQVAANTTGASRIAVINLNGQQFTIRQTATTALLDDATFFVRQHYLDFLGREPDDGGWDYWTSQITQCSTDQTCLHNKSVDVSNAFFFEAEYQQTGAYVYRLYRAAYGNNQPLRNPGLDSAPSDPIKAAQLPSYAAFIADRARVVGGSDLAQSQLDLANQFVQRPEFLAKYPASLSTGAQFVDAILSTIQTDLGVNLSSQRDALITLYNQGGRGAVLYRLADDNQQTNPINNRALIDVEYNRAFVLTEYFGYLKRDPDLGGINFWFGQVNRFPVRDIGIQHAMVCSFITSREYQLRFGSAVTHSNAECPQ